MANNCQYGEAKKMQYAITERLFSEATSDAIGVQHDAHLAIVGIVSFASLAAVSMQEAAADIPSTGQPTTLKRCRRRNENSMDCEPGSTMHAAKSVTSAIESLQQVVL